MKTDANILLSDSSKIRITQLSIGKKVIMAVTGTIILGWVFGHMLGNLQIFLGQNKINAYAKMLADTPLLTWSVRIILGISLILHIWTGIRLFLENRAARPIPYAHPNTVQASVASRSMIYSGLLIFFFAAYHLAHFTFMIVNPEYQTLTDLAGRHDVYSMIVLSFQNKLVSFFYMLTMLLLAIHISHGFASLFQSLGFATPQAMPKLKAAANIIAVLLFLGFSSVPIAVMLGIITLPTVTLQ